MYPHACIKTYIHSDMHMCMSRLSWLAWPSTPFTYTHTSIHLLIRTCTHMKALFVTHVMASCASAHRETHLTHLAMYTFAYTYKHFSWLTAFPRVLANLTEVWGESALDKPVFISLDLELLANLSEGKLLLNLNNDIYEWFDWNWIFSKHPEHVQAKILCILAKYMQLYSDKYLIFAFLIRVHASNRWIS